MVGEGPAALAVVAVGLVSLMALRFVRRPLPCTSAPALAAALAGFAGAGFSAIGFARLAPSPRRLREVQDELRRSGCGFDLIAALRQVEQPHGR